MSVIKNFSVVALCPKIIEIATKSNILTKEMTLTLKTPN